MRKDAPEKETPGALQAYHAYYNMGPGRSLEGLLQIFLKQEEEYEEWEKRTPNMAETRPERAPTKHITTLKRWSGAFNWSERAFNQAQREADEASARTVEDLAKRKQQRTREAQSLRMAGGKLIAAFLKKVTDNPKELAELPLTGRLVVPDNGKPYRQMGMADLLPMATRAMVYGHKLERTETGENQDDKFEGFVKRFVERLCEGAPAAEAEAIKTLAFRIAREEEDGT